MRIKWTEEISSSYAENIYDMCPELNACDFDKHYRGEVIGTNRNIFGTTFLVIACDDGQIRECEAIKAIILNN